jgi:hypothetical protein
MKVDTHILLMPDTNQTWWQECQKSLENEPINLHLVDGIPGHIGRGRAKGYSIGESPYVSCIDPDDLVVPGAFQACIDALEKNPQACGAYTDEVLIDEEGEPIRPGLWSGRPWNPLLQLEPKYLHHIFVMRREFVCRHLDELESKWPHLAEFVLKGLLCAHGPWVHVNRVGYHWRVHPQGNHNSFPVMAVYAARWRIIPTLYRAAQKYQAKVTEEPVYWPETIA